MVTASPFHWSSILFIYLSISERRMNEKQETDTRERDHELKGFVAKIAVSKPPSPVKVTTKSTANNLHSHLLLTQTRHGFSHLVRLSLHFFPLLFLSLSLCFSSFFFSSSGLFKDSHGQPLFLLFFLLNPPPSFLKKMFW
ncbi:hypothetical protein L1049_013146 [Liquidambar formosana]|uniref:Uncharacterized protein n=1 Tax=Liquidambar formosana TaxID=63359 RepID=A0AAP0RMN7_LIQFO